MNTILAAGLLALVALGMGCIDEILPPAQPKTGYFEVAYDVPRDGNWYRCSAVLYQRGTQWGVLLLNVRWVTDNIMGITETTAARKWNGPEEGWLSDLTVSESTSQPISAPTISVEKIGFFPEEDADWVWASHWEGAPYSEGYAFSGGHIYYPGSPHGATGWIQHYVLDETATGIRVQVFCQDIFDARLEGHWFEAATIQ